MDRSGRPAASPPAAGGSGCSACSSATGRLSRRAGLLAIPLPVPRHAAPSAIAAAAIPARRTSTATTIGQRRRLRGATATGARRAGPAAAGGVTGAGSWIITPSRTVSPCPAAWATTRKGRGRAGPSASGREGRTVAVTAALAPPSSWTTDGSMLTDDVAGTVPVSSVQGHGDRVVGAVLDDHAMERLGRPAGRRRGHPDAEVVERGDLDADALLDVDRGVDGTAGVQLEQVLSSGNPGVSRRTHDQPGDGAGAGQEGQRAGLDDGPPVGDAGDVERHAVDVATAVADRQFEPGLAAGATATGWRTRPVRSRRTGVDAPWRPSTGGRCRTRDRSRHPRH